MVSKKSPNVRWWLLWGGVTQFIPSTNHYIILQQAPPTHNMPLPLTTGPAHSQLTLTLTLAPPTHNRPLPLTPSPSHLQRASSTHNRPLPLTTDPSYLQQTSPTHNRPIPLTTGPSHSQQAPPTYNRTLPLTTDPSHLRHALVDDGVSSGLADDQVGPLDNDDSHKEGCVTRVLKHFALAIVLRYGGDGVKIICAGHIEVIVVEVFVWK